MYKETEKKRVCRGVVEGVVQKIWGDMANAVLLAEARAETYGVDHHVFHFLLSSLEDFRLSILISQSSLSIYSSVNLLSDYF